MFSFDVIGCDWCLCFGLGWCCVAVYLLQVVCFVLFVDFVYVIVLWFLVVKCFIDLGVDISIVDFLNFLLVLCVL